MRQTDPGAPSSRLVNLIGGDLSGHRRETRDDGWVRFIPDGGGPVLEVASRIEKRFLGRTEVAVFETDLEAPMAERAAIELRHTGGLKRSKVAAAVVEGGDSAQRVARALASDPRLSEALLPLDFTRFDIHGGPTGCRARVELMGASYVAIALPPVRSYIHLYPDQREAMVRGIEEVRRIIGSAG